MKDSENGFAGGAYAVTGGTQGIGAAVAMALAGAGQPRQHRIAVGAVDQGSEAGGTVVGAFQRLSHQFLEFRDAPAVDVVGVGDHFQLAAMIEGQRPHLGPLTRAVGGPVDVGEAGVLAQAEMGASVVKVVDQFDPTR